MFTLNRVVKRVASSLSPVLANTTTQTFTWNIHSPQPPNMPPNRSVTPCILCVCVCHFIKHVSNQSHTYTHSSTARRAAVYSRPITRLSVKRLEFIRDTESQWQLPTDLTCVYKRRWSDPLGGYHHVNKDIVSLERRGKKMSKNTQRSIKTACGMCKVNTERQVGENWKENTAFLFLLQVVRN